MKLLGFNQQTTGSQQISFKRVTNLFLKTTVVSVGFSELWTSWKTDWKILMEMISQSVASLQQ